jgi:hypothetical protein
VRGGEWLNVGPPLGTPGRRRPQHYALKNAKQAIRDLKIPLVAGEMECNQNVIRKPAPPGWPAATWPTRGDVSIAHWAADPFVLAAALSPRSIDTCCAMPSGPNGPRASCWSARGTGPPRRQQGGHRRRRGALDGAADGGPNGGQEGQRGRTREGCRGRKDLTMEATDDAAAARLLEGYRRLPSDRQRAAIDCINNMPPDATGHEKVRWFCLAIEGYSSAVVDGIIVQERRAAFRVV